MNPEPPRIYATLSPLGYPGFGEYPPWCTETPRIRKYPSRTKPRKSQNTLSRKRPLCRDAKQNQGADWEALGNIE